MPRRWPPHCCVPAFVEGALGQLGYAAPSQEALARVLRVTVGPSDPNPFSLPISADASEWGVRPEVAADAIEQVVSAANQSLAFRHIPFSTIALESYRAVLAAALRGGACVGTGIDPLRLKLGNVPDRRHLVRVRALSGSTVSFIDDSADAPTPIEESWGLLEFAVLDVADGFWLIGSVTALTLDYCLPFSRNS